MQNDGNVQYHQSVLSEWKCMHSVHTCAVYQFSGLDGEPTTNGILHGSVIRPDPCCPP